MVLGVAAVADGAAGVEDLVAGFEGRLGHVGPDGLDDARAVEADDLVGPWHARVVVWVIVVNARADFHVDWVDGAGFYSGDWVN